METELFSFLLVAGWGRTLLMPWLTVHKFLPLSCCRNAPEQQLTPEELDLGKNNLI